MTGANSNYREDLKLIGGNLYSINGWQNTTPDNTGGMGVARWNMSTGAVVFQKYIYRTPGFSGTYEVEHHSLGDNGGNPTAFGSFYNGTKRSGTIINLDSSGNINYQYQITRTNSDSMYINGGSGSGSSMFSNGYYFNGSNRYSVYASNSSGTVDWIRSYSTGAGGTRGEGTANNGSVIAHCGYFGTSSQGGVYGLLDTSGNVVNTIGLRNSPNSDFRNVAIDGSSNFYLVGETTVGGTGNRGIIAKLNSSATVQWQRQLTGSSRFVTFNNITLGADGFVYAVGTLRDQAVSPTQWSMVILKYDTNGNLQWQRQLYISGSTNFFAGTGIVISGSNYYAYAYSGGNNINLVAKLPTDGSKTGTYGSYVYANPGLSESAGANSFNPLVTTLDTISTTQVSTGSPGYSSNTSSGAVTTQNV
jgi:hypothetical protein